MNKKRVCIILFLLLFLGSLGFSAEMNPMRFCVTIPYDIGIRGGFEYRFGKVLGFKADAGIPLSLLTSGVGGLAYDVLGIIYLRDFDKPLQLNILFGVPNGIAALDNQNNHRITFGGSFMLRYGVDVNTSFSLRAGYGYPIFYKDGEVREYSAGDLKKGLDIAFGISWAIVPRIKTQPRSKEIEKN